MQEIIAVSHQEIEGETCQTINARELHAFLAVGKDFSTWMKDRIDQYEFMENQDFIIFPDSGENSKRGRPSKDYHLTLDMAKELSMVERNTKGREARRYFIQVEKEYRKLRDLNQPKRPHRPAMSVPSPCRSASPADALLPNGWTMRQILSDIKVHAQFLRMAGLDGNQALLGAIAHESILAGIPLASLLPQPVIFRPLPVRDAAFLRPVEIAKRLDLLNKSNSASSRQANRLLKKAGLQIYETDSGQWEPTQEGKPFACWRNIGPVTGPEVRQLFWCEKVLARLQTIMGQKQKPDQNESPFSVH
ncbi:hypothetical protein HFQ13_10710 [Acidithiobacillus sp. VAN18-1]|uniref:AntA/AntB antirepressor domain-containing protein n=1 Tax=Igneacidithiobacillus copahuensis TaxID=2724909 RepID=A0AAE3CK99_9PROT|nr:antA/AntB antirepressor family protein [Igneacidithiobacillus copahuensis]MBU2788662.1 hypothetical protein [Igneacidithiobacillus copahuensis]MBU2796654.1 hypothetical protein [Acidithiobacillus sp. VAN18-2]